MSAIHNFTALNHISYAHTFHSVSTFVLYVASCQSSGQNSKLPAELHRRYHCLWEKQTDGQESVVTTLLSVEKLTAN